ncbi:family 16 glycosylhydrolase [Winogradskyella sp. PE311]|uniref:family 16 glycosylhydrolase n=1 Tax=Winogradskyella sp. PE311 TaxID=3366943 RepID=UPI003980307D
MSKFIKNTFMRLKYIVTLSLSLSISFLFSQQTPLDFSSSSHNFSGFDGSGFSFNTNPEDGADDVGQFFNNGSMPWQGFYLDLAEPINLAIEQVITLSFYQFDPNAHTIMVKLENGTEVDVEVVQNNSGTGWSNEITFDFANATISGTSSNTNANGSYSRLTIFIDGGVNSSGTYLIDNINDGSEAVDPNALDVIYTDLVWEDDFDVNGAIDSNKWFHQTQLPSGGNWFNGEEQHYTNRIENSFVDNGFLNIVAIKESFTDQGETKQYTSARLNSKFAFTYGRVDVRAKLPFGDGTWPAIWTLGKNINEDGGYWDNQGFGNTGWPGCGEIDIMEHGLGATNHVSSALHTPCAGCFGNTMNFQSFVLNDVANEFHVYSVNWSPNQITFLIDGVGFYTYNPAVKDDSTWPFYADQYLLLNIAMGGVSGAIDPSFTQSSMVIDYVRVYQNNVLSVGDLFAEKIQVYPNPVSKVLTIKTDAKIDGLSIYNTLGQPVLNRNFSLKNIDVSHLNSGLYILKIKAEGKSVIKRILVN